MKKTICVLILACGIAVAWPHAFLKNGSGYGILSAQEQARPSAGEQAGARESGCRDTLYRVMAVVLAGWFGIGGYIFFVDRKLARLERKHDEL